jgi:hypothetical protein
VAQLWEWHAFENTEDALAAPAEYPHQDEAYNFSL